MSGRSALDFLCCAGVCGKKPEPPIYATRVPKGDVVVTARASVGPRAPREGRRASISAAAAPALVPRLPLIACSTTRSDACGAE